MTVSIEKSHFTGRDEAVSLIQAQGKFARDGAMAAGDLEDVHWHKTSLLIYVLEGSFETLDAASGTSLMAGPGDRISIPARTLHAARCLEPATYVVGFESEQAAKLFRPERPDSLPACSIDDMAWLSGGWTGTLGPMTVEEIWMPPLHGFMETMIRLSVPEGVTMTEFIVVREVEDDAGQPTLLLHLKQFDSEQAPVTDQVMFLNEISEDFVSFKADEGNRIIGLSYTRLPDDGLRVDVNSTASGIVFAELQRARS